MADKNKFEEMLERLVNEDKAGAEELFHDIVVEKSRDIYASLIESDIEIEEEDKEVEEATDEEVDETTDEEVDEATDEEVDESSDEEVDENFDLDEFEVEGEPEMGGDPVDDMMGDIEVGDDEEGEEGEEELEDRVVDLEDALDDLKAEFEKMMGDEEGDEGDDEEEGDEEPEEEAFAFEASDEEVDEASDEEVDEASDEEVDESTSPKSDREQMREYVDKVASGHGAEKKSSGDNGDNTKSPVAGANNMGGTSANIAKGGEAGSGDHAGLGELNPKDQDGGNINVPGGKAAKAGKSEPGHGAEKKGKPETADNKKSVVGK
ncbi:MAG: hypothetical protein CBC91_04730 [Rickettsiales bacterium TMED131]|nr:MAG: hypothetical protein CBC91_04730 [Rickettsiales bacterium TMED131]